MDDAQSLPSLGEGALSPAPDALRAIRDRANEALRRQRDRIDQLEASLTENIESITSLVNDREDAAGSFQQQLAQRDSLLGEREGQLKELNETSARLQTEVGEWTAKFEESQRLVEQFDETVAKYDEQLNTARGECELLRSELSAAQQKAEQQQEALADQEATRDKLAQRVAEMEHELSAAQDQPDASAEYEALTNKFELALADVQQLKKRNTELEDELARRPEAPVEDTAEIVSLRTERDELLQQVENLQQQMATAGNDDQQSELEELQRRFELAVEDIRQLKTEKADLESRLAANASAATVDGGGEDEGWEAQKRKLLASLEGEDVDSQDEQRNEERATISGTIQITDQVIAQKDREITELKAELATQEPAGEDDKREGQIVETVLDGDEIIRRERENLAKLQDEWKEKLREAELEISVQRAKIAREQAELEDKLREFRAFGSPAAQAESVEKPKRRWLAKLGIVDED